MAARGPGVDEIEYVVRLSMKHEHLYSPALFTESSPLLETLN